MTKKIFAVLTSLFLAGVMFALPANAAGSDSPVPYTVDGNGITLPNGDTFKAHGHVNIKYTSGNSNNVESAGIHFDPNNNHPGGVWIGKTNIPWSAFGLPEKEHGETKNFCVTWVQIDGYNQHFGEGGQAPFCSDGNPTPEEPETKDVTLCHYIRTNAAGKDIYKKETVSQKVWNAEHRTHGKNIWEGFVRTYFENDNRGNPVKKTESVDKQGDTNRLNFEGCVVPEDEALTHVTVTPTDVCGSVDDDVKADAATGAEIVSLTKNWPNWSVVAKAGDGFTFDASKMQGWNINGDTATISGKWTGENCDLPETGGEAQFNTAIGVAAIVGLIGVGVYFIARRRTNS